MPIDEINNYIQDKIVAEGLDKVSAVEAADWLDRAGLLENSESRPGLPLRRLLRDGLIVGSHQQANKRWFIYSQQGRKAT